jgi:hypothetical protein
MFTPISVVVDGRCCMSEISVYLPEPPWRVPAALIRLAGISLLRRCLALPAHTVAAHAGTFNYHF